MRLYSGNVHDELRGEVRYRLAHGVRDDDHIVPVHGDGDGVDLQQHHPREARHVSSLMPR